MKEETNHVYELAKKEEKELEGKIRAELDSLGKPELMAVVKDYVRCSALHPAHYSSI